jgi:hypothetical protein
VYWRRRAGALVVTALLVVGAIEVVGWGIGAAASWWEGQRASPSLTRTGQAPGRTGGSWPAVYIVEPGDSLWSIARRLDPSADPRPLVDRLADRAGGSALRPGQRLSLQGL